MKVLVFGGTGWVGHRIALNFASAGHDVTICSRGGKKEFTPSVAALPMIQADKNEETELAQIFASAAYDIIVDSVPSEKSIQGIVRHAKGLKHYIHCSSTGGYAPLSFVPGNETMPYNGYDAGWIQKKNVDELVMELCNKEGFPATVIRPCYISGPGKLPMDNMGGRREDFIADIIAGRELDVVNDGQALLQPIHVDDLAESFLLASRVPDVCIGQIYNICLDHAVTLNQYFKITAEAFGTTPKINYLPLNDMLEKYAGNIYDVGLRFLALHMCFDPSKAKAHLGYAPKHTPEETIIENALWAAEITTAK